MIVLIISFIKLNIKYDYYKKYIDIKIFLGLIFNCNCNNEFKSKMSLFLIILCCFEWIDLRLLELFLFVLWLLVLLENVIV